ncbi:exo-alpha-sialidase [Kineosporia sp. J2-2]|uniref:exo-alpha-sialidase n=1 Tax=Kineosporia corallincola TaxID=2835133 RepID=A0ABS5TQW7_9ACTN|nr:sialidase family protein [Kineosporia corallincola]MBT0773099.1 exo-alpha-sialidase [Kineosporia corallincola]
MTRSSSFRRFAGGLIASCTAVAGLALGTALQASAASGPATTAAPLAASPSSTVQSSTSQSSTVQSSTVEMSTTCDSTPFRSRPSATLWYRIPSIVRTTRGTLVAFAEARDNNDTSDMGDYDIATARSTDNGCSWSAPKVIASDAANRVSNPSALVDAQTGDILLFSSVTVRENSGGQGKGLYLQTSTDDGKTFSPLLSTPVRPDGLKSGLPGPGHGIQLTRTHAGRLIFPVAYRTKDGLYGAYGVYSDDHGKTWHTGFHQLQTARGTDTIEGTIAELDDGNLFISYREKRDQAAAGTARQWALSKDGGETLAGDGLTRSALPIVSVQGSALVPSGAYDNLLLFSAPGDKTRNLRRDMSIFVSTTGGRSWGSRYQLELQSTPGAYSDLVQIGQGVGVLYETGVQTWKERIAFRSVPLSELLRPTKVTSTMKVYRNTRPVPASQNAKAQVRVSVPGTSRPPGRVTLTAKARSGATRSASIDFTYSNKGSRWLVLPKLPAGSYQLTLSYSGTERIKGVRVAAGTLRVVR